VKLKEAAQQYLDTLEAEGRSPHTIAAYGRDLAALVTFTGDLDLDSVTPALLQRFMASPLVQTGPTGQPRAKASINRYRVTLKALFGWAEARWLVARNPSAILKCQRPRALPRETLSECVFH
jgi:integrase/recombinase XerC